MNIKHEIPHHINHSIIIQKYFDINTRNYAVYIKITVGNESKYATYPLSEIKDKDIINETENYIQRLYHNFR